MKFFLYAAAILAVLGTPASAEVSEPEIIVNGHPAPQVEVVMISPGVARLEFGPVYPVFLNKVPSQVRVLVSGIDESKKGTAYLARLMQTPFLEQMMCWQQVKRIFSGSVACGILDGVHANIVIDVGNHRNEVFVLYPVLLEKDTGDLLAFVAHPENARYWLRCQRRTDKVSGFYIDGQGTITIASPEQMRSYEASYCVGK